MPLFRVPLEKEYQSKNGKTRVLVEGYIDVEAESAKDAEKVFGSLAEPLQTVDPRIVWDWEETDWTPEEILEADLDYVDWSFGMPEGSVIKLAEEAHAS